MTWTVIIVGKGMWSYTEKCLDTLLATTTPDDDLDEIYYVDNGTPAGEDSWDRSKDWHHTKCPVNLNFHRTRYMLSKSLPDIWNRCIESSMTTHILLLNNDIEFRGPGWVEKFEMALDMPGVGVTGVIGMSWKDRPFIQGSVFAFKRDVFDQVGEFDPQFEFTCEEVDWCERAAKLGYGIKSFEELRDNGVIHHHEGATRNYYKDDLIHYQYLAHLSRLRFCYKHRYPSIHIHD